MINLEPSETYTISITVSDDARVILDARLRFIRPTRSGGIEQSKHRAFHTLQGYFPRRSISLEDRRDPITRASLRFSNRPLQHRLKVALTVDQINAVIDMAEIYNVAIIRMRPGSLIPHNLLGQFLDALICGDLYQEGVSYDAV